MSSPSSYRDDIGPPAIGGLLRLAWQAHRDRLYETVTAAGFADVTRAHFVLFRWPTIDGMRPGEVAELVGLSKQAVNDLLGELERLGYVKRQRHPKDGRARAVRLTQRGQELQQAAHETSRALEQSWAAVVGNERFAALRGTLEEMVARGLP